MKDKQTRVKPVLFTLLVSLTGLSLSSHALADSFPFSGAPSMTKTQAAVAEPKVRNNHLDIDSFSFLFLQGLELTSEPRVVFTKILDKQMPVISSNIETIEYARGLLRDMALAKTYDKRLPTLPWIALPMAPLSYPYCRQSVNIKCWLC